MPSGFEMRPSPVVRTAQILDCTAGRGGHASLLAADAGPSGTAILCDLDAGNLAFAAERVVTTGIGRVISLAGSFVRAPRDLVRDGLAVVTGLATGDREGASIEDVAGLWGPIRPTNYGEVFHVRAQADPVNLAFTPRALNVHTDNPYRRPVPGYQLLHCLVASGSGGVTVLVDGFRAAEVLRHEDPEAFAVLAGRRVPFRWAGDGFDLRNRSATGVARRSAISLGEGPSPSIATSLDTVSG